MFEFKDTEGRVWVVPAITLKHLMSLNKTCGIELNDIITNGYLWDATDQALITVGATLWCFCAGQHEVEEEDFFLAFDGEVFGEAQAALAERVVNFIQPSRRESLKDLIETMRRAQQQYRVVAKKQLAEIEKEVAKAVEELSSSVFDEQEKQDAPTLDLSTYVS